MASSSKAPPCKNLVLDAGPLLTLSPLRGLAETYLTVPQVLDELKDRRAREHFEQLGLSAGVRVEIRTPDAASLAKGTQHDPLLHPPWPNVDAISVIEHSKKTGDYAVLSHADLCVLALTYALDAEEKAQVRTTNTDSLPTKARGALTSTIFYAYLYAIACCLRRACRRYQ
jgi:RNA-binding protein NOB1